MDSMGTERITQILDEIQNDVVLSGDSDPTVSFPARARVHLKISSLKRLLKAEQEVDPQRREGENAGER